MSVPPGLFSRMEMTPAYKGNQPGQSDLLPGQVARLRRRPRKVRRWFSKVVPRRR
jgi:hypothetical protein